MRKPTTTLLTLSLALLGCGEYDPSLEGDDGASDEGKQSSIVLGTTDVTAYPNEALRSVMVIRQGVGVCSGTVMRKNVVLTAAHCVTTDGFPAGPLAPLDKITVNGVRSISVLRAATGIDAALVFFAASESVTNVWENFTALDPYGATAYNGKSALVMGYGLDINNANDGILRRGFQKITAVNAAYILTNNWQGVGLFANNLQSGTAINHGDSGGGLFTTTGPSYPTAVFGVTSAGGGAPDTTSIFAQTHDFRTQFRQAIALRVNDSISVGFDAATDLTNRFQAIQGTTGTAPAWAVSGSALVQTSNAPQAFQLQIGTFENVHLTTFATSTDDDTMGLVLRYVDKSNHYRCEVDRAHRWVRLVKRRAGTDTVLATTLWTGSFDGGDLTAGASEQSLYCTYRDTVVTAVDATFPIGKVGLYNHFNKGGKFLSFQSTQDPPLTGDW